jgi:hypothetical protein
VPPFDNDERRRLVEIHDISKQGKGCFLRHPSKQ